MAKDLREICQNPKCRHRWYKRQNSPVKCPKCGHRYYGKGKKKM